MPISVLALLALLFVATLPSWGYGRRWGICRVLCSCWSLSSALPAESWFREPGGRGEVTGSAAPASWFELRTPDQSWMEDVR